jgi:hypothetical protein
MDGNGSVAVHPDHNQSGIDKASLPANPERLAGRTVDLVKGVIAHNIRMSRPPCNRGVGLGTLGRQVYSHAFVLLTDGKERNIVGTYPSTQYAS